MLLSGRVVPEDNCWRIFHVAFFVLQGLACFKGNEYVTYCSLHTKVWITNMLLNWKCWAYWILDITCCNCIDSRLQNQLSFSRCLSLFWNTLKLKYSGSFWERTCNLSSYCCEVTCHVTRTRLHVNRNVFMCTMNAECSISVRLHSFYYGSQTHSCISCWSAWGLFVHF